MTDLNATKSGRVGLVRQRATWMGQEKSGQRGRSALPPERFRQERRSRWRSLSARSARKLRMTWATCQTEMVDGSPSGNVAALSIGANTPTTPTHRRNGSSNGPKYVRNKCSVGGSAKGSRACHRDIGLWRVRLGRVGVLMRSNIIDLTVQFQHQTAAAVCIRETETSDDIWIPKSRCEIDPDRPTRGQIITLTTDENTASEKGLI